MTKNCILCDKPKQPRFWLCIDCAKRYGVYMQPYHRWPKWMREFIRFARLIEVKDAQFHTNCLSLDRVLIEKIVDLEGDCLY